MVSKKSPRLAIADDGSESIPKPVLAESIVKLSNAAQELARSGLNKQAIVVLLADKTKCSKALCRRVLEGLEQLRLDYTKL